MRYLTRNFFSVPVTNAITAGTSGVGARVAQVVVPPEDACRWRVTLAPLVPFGIEAFTAPQWGNTGPKAFVTWGDMGGRFVAAVDWHPLGCTFSVSGHDITVDVRALNDMTIPAGVNPQAYCSIVPSAGHKDAATRPTFSRRILFGGAGTVAQDMPPFARAVRWWNRTAGAVVGVGVRFLDDAAAGTVRYSGAVNFLADRYTQLVGNSEQFAFDELRVPAYAQFAEFTVSAAVTLQVEYELDLG